MDGVNRKRNVHLNPPSPDSPEIKLGNQNIYIYFYSQGKWK